MTKKSRRNHSRAFKAKLALTARSRLTLLELAQQHDVHRKQITQLKSHPPEEATDFFGQEKSQATMPRVDLKAPHAKKGELRLENYFL